eukprot:843730-Prymnesium_polylepis.1
MTTVYESFPTLSCWWGVRGAAGGCALWRSARRRRAVFARFNARSRSVHCDSLRLCENERMVLVLHGHDGGTAGRVAHGQGTGSDMATSAVA